MENLTERMAGTCPRCGAYLSNNEAVTLHLIWHNNIDEYLAAR